MTNASTTVATRMPVTIGTSAHTMVSQNISKAPSNLLVCETSAPLNRLAWKPTLWSVRWSKMRWNSNAIPRTSMVHAAHSTTRHPMTVPRIWLSRYPTTSGQLLSQLTVPLWIRVSSSEMTNGPRNCPMPTANTGPTMDTTRRAGVTPAASQKRRSVAVEVDTAILRLSVRRAGRLKPVTG